MKKRIISLFLVVFTLSLMMLTFTSCSDPYEPTHYATIEIEHYGTIELELYGNAAPITVKNFVALANDGFYEGLTFHRIIDGFMIQGGGYEIDGTEKDADSIKGEFSSNGVKNPIKHERGVISMARTNDKNSASSQFFIMHEASSHLDGEYAAFGKVISGIEVVDAICEQVPQGYNGAVNLAYRPIIKSITIREA
ncbi:MAG: peptidylprolyl isomerase [Clostridia bacterium]|nr:peptidylprolyl isomerase [Clostridia bacterium]